MFYVYFWGNMAIKSLKSENHHKITINFPQNYTILEDISVTFWLQLLLEFSLYKAFRKLPCFAVMYYADWTKGQAVRELCFWVLVQLPNSNYVSNVEKWGLSPAMFLVICKALKGYISQSVHIWKIGNTSILMGTVTTKNKIFEFCFLFWVQHISGYNSKALKSIKIIEINHIIYPKQLCMSGICAQWIWARYLYSNTSCGHTHQQILGRQPDFNSFIVKVYENNHLIKSLWGVRGGYGWPTVY